MNDVYLNILNYIDEVAVFVITSDKYDVVYYNEKAKNCIPELKIGKKCNYGRSPDCTTCPLHGIEGKQSNIISKTDKKTGYTFSMKAARIMWNEHTPAFVITISFPAEFGKGGGYRGQNRQNWKLPCFNHDKSAGAAREIRDSLTGLFSKESGIARVREYMVSRDQRQTCALMLLDMDNFGMINEDEGVPFADAVLQDVALILAEETGEDDILIRMGGDEFMLFVKGCDKARATIVGPRIAERVRGMFLENRNINISVSIGMCVTDVVNEYDALYHCADSTLQFVKANNKGHAACYLDTSIEIGTVLTDLYKGQHSINTIERNAGTKEDDLLAFGLDLLGQSKKIGDAVALLLARIGRQCALDRVSVWEISREFSSSCFSHQWSRDKNDSLPVRTHYLPKPHWELMERQYDEERLSVFPIVEHAFAMPHCLHAAMYDRSEYVGALIFERAENRPWSLQDRKLAREMAKLISSYLMKERADAVSRAKTDFLSRMSHEIRTPMNAISGMTTIAKSVVRDPERIVACLEKIDSANKYLLSLINDILDMSKIESGKIELNLEAMDMQKQLDTIFALMQSQIEAKHIKFTLKNNYLSNRLILADAVRLNQILVNIIGNAVKFTDPCGEVQLSLDVISETGKTVSLRFSVKDTGIGIDKEALSRIFNAFEQANKVISTQYGGTGLGLAISSRLVRMMGGSLEVESVPGRGTTFYFTLTFMYAEPSVSDESVISEGESVRDFSEKCILLVEDNELNREIAVTLLQMHGAQVETAENGLEAVNRFLSHEPYYYDGILMDIRMPIMDGLEATRQIRIQDREDSKTIPIIAMTANAFDEDSHKSLESGMNGHLSKPIELEQVLKVLNDCLLKNEIMPV